MRELFQREVFVIGGEEHTPVGKVPPPELIERVELSVASGARLWVARVNRRGTDVAERQQVRRLLHLCNLERFLVFPFRPRHRHTTVNATIFALRGLLR